jgi:hypothetical protein
MCYIPESTDMYFAQTFYGKERRGPNQKCQMHVQGTERNAQP